MGDDGKRQRVERVGARRARLTRVEGTLSDSEAEATLRTEPAGATAPTGERGPNDDRLRRDRPPHW